MQDLRSDILGDNYLSKSKHIPFERPTFSRPNCFSSLIDVLNRQQNACDMNNGREPSMF